MNVVSVQLLKLKALCFMANFTRDRFLTKESFKIALQAILFDVEIINFHLVI